MATQLTDEMKEILNNKRKEYVNKNKEKIKCINKNWLSKNDSYSHNYYMTKQRKDELIKPRIANLTEEEKKERRLIKSNIYRYNKKIDNGISIDVEKYENLKQKLEFYEKKIKNE